MPFRQCLMRRWPDGRDHNPEVHVAWIPVEFAKVGKQVDLKNQDGSWSEGWLVVEAWTTVSDEYIREHERDHKDQHLASDKMTPNKGLGLPK